MTRTYDLPRNKRLDKELHLVAERYSIDIAEPLALIVAVLRCQGFTVRSMGNAYARPYEEGFGINDGPHICIESPNAYKYEGKKLARRNLRERDRLINLLGEFYAKRTTPIHTRLVVQGMAAGSFMVNCQGAEIMALPENKHGYDKWSEAAYDELIAFTEFLVARTN